MKEENEKNRLICSYRPMLMPGVGGYFTRYFFRQPDFAHILLEGCRYTERVKATVGTNRK